MHPSAYVFSKTLASTIATRCGRFFQTNGVEYCAWPLAAMVARTIVYIDAPLAICGRTYKSWGTNMILSNPGTKRINEFIADVEQQHRFAPLRNFTMCNLRAEGILTAKSLLPGEFGAYDFDELQYLRVTLAELTGRQSLGVDVSADMQDLERYLAKRSSSLESLRTATSDEAVSQGRSLRRRVRRIIGDLGARRLRKWVSSPPKAASRYIHPGFRLSGAHSGFQDILGCAALLTRALSEPRTRSVTDAPSVPRP
jgi:hypothetical protein